MSTKSILKSHPWIIPVSITLTLFLYNKYEYWSDKIEFSIISQSKLIKPLKKVEALDIKLSGNNSLDFEISFFVCKIEKKGKKSLSKGVYDDKNPLRISIVDGNFIAQPEISRWSKRLSERDFKEVEISENKKDIEFSKLFLEHADYFICEFYVIHDKNTNVDPNLEGKISGVSLNNIRYQTEPDWVSNYVNPLIKGGIIVMLLRLILYSIFGYSIFYYIQNRIGKRKEQLLKKKRTEDLEKIKKRRQSHVEEYTQYLTIPPNPLIQKFLQLYIYHGKDVLIFLEDILDEQKALKRVIQNDKQFIPAFDFTLQGLEIQDEDAMNIFKTLEFNKLNISDGEVFKKSINTYRIMLNNISEYFKENNFI